MSKANKIERPNRTGLIVTVVLVLLIGLGFGAVLGYDKLKAVYLEQCVITDMPSQVEITSGKMVHPSTIAEELGLRPGANLALIDFTAKREELLAKVPNLRSVRIARRLPDKVIVTAEERTPVARMGLKGKGGFVMNEKGVPHPVKWWNGYSAMLDMTHPQGRSWFGRQLDRLQRDFGVDGFKLDECDGSDCSEGRRDGSAVHPDGRRGVGLLRQGRFRFRRPGR